MEKDFEIIGKRIKFLRLQKGVKQTVLANKIGMSQTNMSNIEAGRTAITIQNLLKISQELNCKMADFFVDFDGEEEAAANEFGAGKKAISIEEAVQILRLLKAVDINGL